MIINFIGNYQKGYVGEEADEVHLARELERLGNTVHRIPRDAWREYVIEGFPKGKYDVPEDLKADINIICKWHHFYDGSFTEKLRKLSGAPVLYWVWDYMWDQGFPDWHLGMARAADLYLSGEGGLFPEYVKQGIKPCYFQMDVCDGDLPTFRGSPKEYDVVFTGSYLKQGDRVPFLTEINKEIPVKIFSWNYEEWIKEGFEAVPAVYGAAYNALIARSKVVLGFSVNPNCWGYWSNRVGKVLRAGGKLCQQYAPGMELMLTCPAVGFFSTPKQAIEMLKDIPDQECESEHWEFTSACRMAQLGELIENYLAKGKEWNKIP